MEIVSYATLEELKQYLWITDNTNDNVLTEMLNTSYLLLNHLIWVDTMNLTTGVEFIEQNKLYTNWLQDWFYLTNKPVLSINKVWWENYSWVKWTDYMVIYDRKVLFNRINFLDKIKFWLLEVEYTWWYNRDNDWVDELPDDLKLMQMMLVWWMWNSKWMEWVSSYKIWDESITFGSRTRTVDGNTSIQTSDDIYFSFRILLNRYKTFNLP